MNGPEFRIRSGNASNPVKSWIWSVYILAILSLWALPSTTAQTTTSAAPASSSTPTIAISGLPVRLTLPSLNSTHPIIRLSLPSTSPLYLTFNVLSKIQTSLTPTILLSTSSPPSFDLISRTSNDASSGGLPNSDSGVNKRSRNGGSWKVQLEKGFGNWTWTSEAVGVQVLIGLGILDDGTIDNSVNVGNGNVVLQIGASSIGPLNSISPSHPVLGDTTSNSALIFSPLLEPSPQIQPSYPNYTLPNPQMYFPAYTPSNPSFSNPILTLILVPTSSSPTNDGLDLSFPAVSAANISTGAVGSVGNMVINASSPTWMNIGEEGFRTFWVIGNLVASTNYTAWVVDTNGTLSYSIWLQTKESNFECQLVLPTTICPSIGYTAPLSQDQGGPLTQIPDNLTDILTSSLEAFSTSLLSMPCGRDKYSHVSTCLDCHSSYRDWICRILIPQCASNLPPSPPSLTLSNSNPPPSPSTISRTPSNPRFPNTTITYPIMEYNELLPCLSSCNAVDRNCPVTLEFRCPTRDKNGNMSYGFIGDDNGFGDGDLITGIASSDIWGNRWCNG